jgi:hypothetical protein
METETQLAFVGTKEEQNIASHAFEAMKRKGIMVAVNTPIRMSVEAIAKVLTKEGGPMAGTSAADLAPKIDAALAKNKAVFARADKGEYVTTKSGHAQRAGEDENSHTFKQRLNTQAQSIDVEAAKEYEDSLVNKAAQRADRASILVETVVEARPWHITPPVQHPQHHITFENTTVIPQHLIQTPLEPPRTRGTEALPAPAARPVAETATASPPPAPAAAPAPTAPPARPVPGQPVTRREQEAEPAPKPGAEAATAEQPAVPAPAAPTSAAASASAQPATAQPAAPAPTPAATPARPAPAERKEPPAPVITGPVEMRIETADGPQTIDLRDSVDDLLANEAVASALTEMIGQAVEEDTRLVRFGSDIFPEEAIERFSKGDFRRIKDFLDEPETGGVASDHDFMGYVFNRRPEQPDYEKIRFSLNFRLHKEKKDFEFVGIDSNRLWMNAGAAPVALPKRKPAEVGQDYRFLEDPAIAWVEEEAAGDEGQEVGPLDYVLTYYEYENGVLPYDHRAKRLFRGPVFEDQRAALIQFEIPQLYASVLAELRYPTGNRGGFIMGLTDFFTEHLVPGAKFTVLPTDRAENILEVQYVRENEREENLLQFDDRRARYVFRPVSFAADTDPSALLTQEKFGKLHNAKKLEDAERKRPDLILANAFEMVGEESDGKYWAILDDLYPVANLDRPMSRSWLKTLLSGAYPFFYADETTEGAYFYDPSKRPS